MVTTGWSSLSLSLTSLGGSSSTGLHVDVTVTEYAAAPGALGVPERVAVAGSNVSPAGRAPWVTWSCQLSTGDPVAEKVKLNGWPTAASAGGEPEVSWAATHPQFSCAPAAGAATTVTARADSGSAASPRTVSTLGFRTMRMLLLSMLLDATRCAGPRP